uniref:laccase-5-like n=1 Tax=Styela clava TaxID=7725 RepID=UPI00193A76E9|nr:laccase-5-like [Styela clava]
MLDTVCVLLILTTSVKTDSHTQVIDAGQNSNDPHPCDRTCEYPASPQICEYDFVVEWYYTMSKACYDCPFSISDCSRPHCVAADGVGRPLITVNRLFPGPQIRHGLHMKDTPHMNGVPMLTQCAIPAKTSFTYEFTAYPPGTHFWHSHAGLQKADGLAGALIINRDSEDDPHRGQFDVDSAEHVLFLADWWHTTTLAFFLKKHHFEGGPNRGDNVLINGKGVFEEFFNSTDNSTHFTPRKTFYVEQNTRYRFRMISNAASCAYAVSIDGHELKVIATDGHDVEPYMVSSLAIHSGERYDFVVDASNEVANYWIRVRALESCARLSQMAILRYQGAPESDPSTTAVSSGTEKELNNPWADAANESNSQVTSLKTMYSRTYPARVGYDGTPDQTHFIGFDIYMINHPSYNHPELYAFPDVVPRFFPQLNNVSFAFPKYPMLTQSKYIDDDHLCNPETAQWNRNTSRFCQNNFCSCPYVINAKVGNLVELVLYDEGMFPFVEVGHPMHLHGQHFKVVAMKKVGDSLSPESVKEIHANGGIEYNFNTVLKDTVIVPHGGYTVIRFFADNPGVWFFHCHQIFHLHIGMSLVFKVGEPSDWVKPPEDFPKCGPWPGKAVSRAESCLFKNGYMMYILLQMFCYFAFQNADY